MFKQFLFFIHQLKIGCGFFFVSRSMWWNFAYRVNNFFWIWFASLICQINSPVLFTSYIHQLYSPVIFAGLITGLIHQFELLAWVDGLSRWFESLVWVAGLNHCHKYIDVCERIIFISLANWNFLNLYLSLSRFFMKFFFPDFFFAIQFNFFCNSIQIFCNYSNLWISIIFFFDLSIFDFP